jgi:hypothetical protein
MSTIKPTTSPLSKLSSHSSTSVAVVHGAPTALKSLSVGQLLEATVTSQTAKNTFQIKTPVGKFFLQSTLSLPKGGALVMQLVSQSPFIQFQINSLNGTNPTLKTKIQGNVTASTNHAQGSPTPKLAVGNVLLATLMSPSVEAPSTVGQAPISKLTSPIGANRETIIRNGFPLHKSDTSRAIRMKSLITTGAKAATIMKNATEDQNLRRPIIASASATKPLGHLQVGSQVGVKVTSIQRLNLAAANTIPATPSSKTTKIKPTLSAGFNLRGAVTGCTPSGHPIVQTKLGAFVLATQTSVPRGTTIYLEVVTSPTVPVSEAQATQAPHESLFRSRSWPALEHAFQALEEVRPGRSQKLINSIIPRPGASLTSSMIFFLSALKGGDLNSWMGERVLRLIDRNQPNVSSRIREDFTTLSRIVEEPAPSDWRVALIPINNGDEIQQIRLLLRQNEKETDEDTTSNTRFVIDVKLSRFGRFQMDGLVREKGKSLDLILRSDTHFADTIKNDIRTIFREASDLSGLKGGVNFQAAPADFINISDPLIVQDVGLVV